MSGVTRRERLERKRERRAEWAEKARQRAAARFDAADAAVEGIPPGQPILVGHHSERRHRAALAKCHDNMHKGIEEQNLAQHHASKAKGISDQLERSVFSDDADAIDQLRARIAEREAERDRWKAYNASCRKGKRDVSLLDEAQQKEIATLIRVCPYQIGDKGQAPGYIMANLGGNIRRDKERITEIERRTIAQADAEAAPGGVLISSPPGWAEYVSITFAEKPDRSILTALKSAGFRWGGGCWSGRRENIPACVLELAQTA